MTSYSPIYPIPCWGNFQNSMTVKKWDYSPTLCSPDSNPTFLFIDFSVYDFYYFAKYQAFFSFSSLSSRSRSALGLLRSVRLMLCSLRLSLRKIDSTESGHRCGSLAVRHAPGQDHKARSSSPRSASHKQAHRHLRRSRARPSRSVFRSAHPYPSHPDPSRSQISSQSDRFPCRPGFFSHP